MGRLGMVEAAEVENLRLRMSDRARESFKS